MFIESLVRYLVFSSCATRTEGYMTTFPCPKVVDFDTFDNKIIIFAQGWGF